MLDPILSSIAKGIVRHRLVWGAGMLLLLGGSLALAGGLSFGHRAEDLLPRRAGPPDSVELAVRRLVGGAGRVIVFLDAPAPLDVTNVAPVMDTLAVLLGDIPGVRRVEHRLAPELGRYIDDVGADRMVLYLPTSALEVLGARLSRAAMEEALLASDQAPGDGPATARVLARSDPLNVLGPAFDVLQRVTGQVRIRLVDGYFALPASRTFFLVIEPSSGLEDVSQVEATVTRIEEVLRETAALSLFDPFAGSARLFAAGRPVSYVSALSTAREDVRRVARASGIVVLILLAVFFRRPLAPVVVMAPVAFGLVLTAAVAFLIFGTVSLLGGIFVAALIGLGVDFGIHIATHYWISADATDDRETALASAMVRPGWGILFGGLSSAAAFFSLVMVSYPIMNQLAWLTAIGLVAILLASFTVLPWALSFTPPAHRPQSRWQRWATLVHDLGSRYARLGIVVWIAAMALAVWGARSIVFETHPWKVAVRGNPKTAEMERLRARLGSSFTPLLMVSQDSTLETALARDREAIAVLDTVAGEAGVASVESLTRWFPAPEQQQANIRYVQANAPLFSPGRFRHDFTEVVSRMEQPDPYLVDRYLPLLVRFLNPSPTEFTLDDLTDPALASIVDRHVERFGDDVLVISYVYLSRFPWAEGAIDRFVETVDQQDGGPLERVTFVGNALRSASHPEILRRDTLVATAVAFALVATVLGLQFRRVKAALLCLLPLVCGVAVALGFMGFAGIELNVLTLSVAPVLVGIGVDDGIHMMQRLTRGDTPLVALQETGAAMTMTTLTTVGAFLCFGLASFAGVREVGYVAAVGLVVCLLASLHLLPIVFRAVGR